MASHGVPRVSGAVADKSEAAKERERKQIEEYKALEVEVAGKIGAHDYSEVSLDLTSKLLTRNPEYYTIWNYRRVILQNIFEEALRSPKDGDDNVQNRREKDLEVARKAGLTAQQYDVSVRIKDDLWFLVPLLRQFPKCYWIWNHRSWLLKSATEHLNEASVIEIWQGELGLVTKMLGLDSRNFHGWNYRRSVIAALESLTGTSMIQSEFDYTTKMIRSNLSNFSAWHNRSQLIPRLLDERDASSEERRKFLDEEFEQITTALYTDPYDQSLWFYHQYLMSTLDLEAPTNSSQYQRNTQILRPVGNAESVEYLERELDNVREMLDGAEDCKYIYQALLEYSKRYLDIESGNAFVTSQEVAAWITQLRHIDPLREGRWRDFERELNV